MRPQYDASETTPNWIVGSLYGVVPMELLHSATTDARQQESAKAQQLSSAHQKKARENQAAVDFNWLPMFF